jgi:hypothetical protein
MEAPAGAQETLLPVAPRARLARSSGIEYAAQFVVRKWGPMVGGRGCWQRGQLCSLQRKLLYCWKYQFEGGPERRHANLATTAEERKEKELRDQITERCDPAGLNRCGNYRELVETAQDDAKMASRPQVQQPFRGFRD